MIPFPDISPELFAFDFFGFELALRWYALAYIIGILIAWWLGKVVLSRPQMWRDNQPVMRSEQFENLITYLILGVIVGGRLGYVLFYSPEHFFGDPLAILKIWQGGMSFHGGLLGVAIVAFIFALHQRLSLLSTGDLLALMTPPGLLLGRIANFINAELWGRPSDLPWGVVFPGQAAQDCGQQIGTLCARHPSQLYEAAFEGFLLGTVLLWIAFRKSGLKKPGILMGSFLVGYGLARFVVEFVRQPDAQFITDGNPIGFAWRLGEFGLTQGQALSLPMIALGVGLIWRANAGEGGDEEQMIETRAREN
ncbi:prolipoprotein diacylglyceryl transferase [Aliiroseovarius crassostreae]|uniref:prolipoprotein diacylglyceryl transferase n=1 Tax=Aliiroseovarius crassostreae TaxID=154981 RepID=UPI0021B03449|nr:prolipoprotein diacylglyceryl transferase [Aliiroseovarius crassostreae]UWQ00243.1 prolipoprotein diacylglyceryl transferase [Aliiroseovarius crassostreae]